MTGNIVRLDRHMAFTCDCGSVNFALLLSGGIECNKCGEVHPFEWSEYEASRCPECASTGVMQAEAKVDSSGRTQAIQGCCDYCEGLGWVGKDATKRAEIEAINDQ